MTTLSASDTEAIPYTLCIFCGINPLHSWFIIFLVRPIAVLPAAGRTRMIPDASLSIILTLAALL